MGMEDMDAGNQDAIRTLSGNSVLRIAKISEPTTSHKRFEVVQRMSVNEKQQGFEASRKNSNRRTDLSFSSEHGHIINQDGSQCFIENHHDVDFHDGNRHDKAYKSLLISSHKPVTTEPNGSLGYQLVMVNQDGQKRNGKRTKIRIKGSTKTSTDCEQVNDDELVHLETEIKDLKKNNAMNCKKLRYFSDACLQLQEENDLLMDELKQWYTPEMMLDLDRSNLLSESTM